MANQAKMQILYKAKNGKTVSLEMNPEETMQQITEKIQDKGGIRPCNVILTKIDTRCHSGNFTLQEFLLEDISEEINICLLSPDETDVNETKTTEIEEPPLQATNISDEDKLKQMKDDLLCNLRAELKNILAENKIDTVANSGISYRKHIEVLQKQLDYLKGEIIEKSKIISNLISAMTKNPSTSLQGSKSPWLPSSKANEFIDHRTSTRPLCLDANTPKLNLLKNPFYDGENYINLLHSDELSNSKNTENFKIKEQLKSKQLQPSEQLKLSLAKQLAYIRNSKHQIYLKDKSNTTKNVNNKIYIRDKSLNRRK